MTKNEYMCGLMELNQKFSTLLDDLVAVCRDYQHIFEYLAFAKNKSYNVLNQQSGVNDFIKIVNVYKEDDNTGVCIKKQLHRNKKLAAWGIHIIIHKQDKLCQDVVSHSFSDEGALFSKHLGKVKEDLCEIKCLKHVLKVRFDRRNNYKLVEHMIIDNWDPNNKEGQCACKGGSCGFECACACHKNPNHPCYTGDMNKECSSCCTKKCEGTCDKDLPECCPAKKCCESKCCEKEASSCCTAKKEACPNCNSTTKCVKCQEKEKIAKQTCGCTDHVCEGTCCKKEPHPCHCPESAPCGGKCGNNCTCDEKK